MTDTTPTPADRPADQLRAAAEQLRAAAAAVPSDDWGTRAWHVEECSDTDTMESCPCIVAQGERKEFDQPQVPLIQYVADAETTEHAAWIALMHPGVGLALAAWLEREGLIWQVIDDASAHPEETGLKVTVGASTHVEALAVARQLLGTTKGEGAAGCAMPGFVGCECDHVTGCQHPAAPPAPADRAAVLNEIAAQYEQLLADIGADTAKDPRYWTGVQHVTLGLRRLADAAAAGVQPPTEGEAHPAEHHWAAELHDPIANEWVPFGSSNIRDTAVHRLARARKVAPLWKDGTPTERRLVRATTTYTVEPEPAAPAAPEEPQ